MLDGFLPANFLCFTDISHVNILMAFCHTVLIEFVYLTFYVMPVVETSKNYGMFTKSVSFL